MIIAPLTIAVASFHLQYQNVKIQMSRWQKRMHDSEPTSLLNFQNLAFELPKFRLRLHIYTQKTLSFRQFPF